MNGKAVTSFLLIVSIFLSLGGLAAFLYLFAPSFNIYWFILTPIIFALYQLPAVFVYWHYRRRKALARARQREQDSEDTDASSSDRNG